MIGGAPPDFLSWSHGEGFLRFFGERLMRQGFYILDEPESALSPTRQIELLRLLGGWSQAGGASDHGDAFAAAHGMSGGSALADYAVRPRRDGFPRHGTFPMMRDFCGDPDRFIDEALSRTSLEPRPLRQLLHFRHPQRGAHDRHGRRLGQRRPAELVRAEVSSGQGLRVIPVNPGQAGKQDSRPHRLRAAFRHSRARSTWSTFFAPRMRCLASSTEALALDPRPKVVWMQLGVRTTRQPRGRRQRGSRCVMNRCPKIEYGRLSGEIGWTGRQFRDPVVKEAGDALGLPEFGVRGK